MTRQKLLIITCIITCYLVQAQGADKYTDENRPYEFGFTIDGQQHRHEEKDSKGLIKGEYGFITADGVYHVTVYATDEQGRFKILSMKNIRYQDYKGLPGAPTTARQGHSLALPPPASKLQPSITSQKLNSVLAPAPKPALELETISIEPPANSCSHCSLPTTSTATPEINIPPIIKLNGASDSPNAPSPSYPFNAGNIQYSPPGNTPSVYQQNGFNVQSQEQYTGKQENSFNGNQGFGQAPQEQAQQNNFNKAQSIPQRPSESKQPFGFNGVSSIGQAPNLPGQQITPGGQQFAFVGQSSPGGQQLTPDGQQFAPGGQQFAPGEQQFTPGGQQFTTGGEQINRGGQQITPNGQQYQGASPQDNNFERTRSGKQYIASPIPPSQNSRTGGSGISQTSLKSNQNPMLVYAQMQIVGKNTDIHAKRSGEKDGLPAGIKEDDVLKLLYTFNYTLGFQAHFEEGYTNGEKRGYYYTTGRNGVRTRIDYVADENGFRPTLSQEVLDLLSDDVPKENTEKEEKYGLKGYEFKWLYFPPNTSQ